MSKLTNEQIEDFKKREAKIFDPQNEYPFKEYPANYDNQLEKLVEDLFKVEEDDWALKILLECDYMIFFTDSTHYYLDNQEVVNCSNVAPKLAEMLFNYDKIKAKSWLEQAEKIALHADNYALIAKIAAERLHDFDWTVRCLKKGFDVIWEDYTDGYDNSGLSNSPEEYAASALESYIWNGPKIDIESQKLIEWKWNPVPSLDNEKGIALWKHVKPVMKDIYEFWEEELWLADYNDVLLENLEHDFSEEVEWINRIKEKMK